MLLHRFTRRAVLRCKEPLGVSCFFCFRESRIFFRDFTGGGAEEVKEEEAAQTEGLPRDDRRGSLANLRHREEAEEAGQAKEVAQKGKDRPSPIFPDRRWPLPQNLHLDRGNGGRSV